jgi:CubicO group peptidase (beta-lactamase class C family)
VHTLRITVVVLVALAAVGHRAAAQSLPENLFQRYLEALRVSAGIPGLSAVIVQNGVISWKHGFGYQDLEARIAAAPDTPYPILDLSQTLAATVLLQQCLDLRHLEITDRVRRWVPQYPEAETTVGQLLAHASPSGGFKYSMDRFATLGGVFEQCASQPSYARGLADEILEWLEMPNSVPGGDLGDANAPDRRFFSSDELGRYSGVLARLAVPYRVNASRRATRSEYPSAGLTASTGVISSAVDLAEFDGALGDGLLLSLDTRNLAWSQAGSMPTGLGWFVQTYNGERLVWHFGLAPDAYSSLILKVPERRLTLILLANSDGLSAPYALEEGDVTKSHFARTFLRLFIG